MELYVNGEKVDITLDNEKTINDVLKAFEEEAEKNDATTIGITINGCTVPPEEFDEKVNSPIEENTKIELKVLSKMQVLDSFKKVQENIKNTSEALKEIPAILQSGKEKDAGTIFEKLADCVDNFCHTATLSALFQDLYQKLIIDGKDVNSFFEEFAGIFADFEQSLENKDTVTSSDLCEYEISPRLEKISTAINNLF